MSDPVSTPSLRSIERYPGSGGKPFADSPEHRLVFKGRHDDTEALLQDVLAARLTVLYGVSGLGKTSLLQAGLFPRLRDEGFLPVYVRVAETSSPAALVVDAVRDAAAAQGVELEVGDESTLWEFFTTSLFWRGERLVTPVLVFDQFEEIFGVQPGTRDALAAEIGALASKLPPDGVRARASGAGRPPPRSKPPEVKVVLSLREEDFGALQDLSWWIPGLFQERFRLSPLTREQAAQAIREPAAVEVGDAPDLAFDTPPFELDADAMQDVLAFLDGPSHEIQSWEVQQVCSQLEKELVRGAVGAGRRLITRADIQASGALKAILEDFYRRTMATLRPATERRRARRLCEQGLLTAGGRRVMLEASQIRGEWGVAQQTLDALDAMHVIRHVRRLGGVHYELTHDRLAEAIARIRPWRLPKRYQTAAVVALVASLLLVLVAVAWMRSMGAARAQAEELVAFLLRQEFLDKLRPLATIEVLSRLQERVDAYLPRSGLPPDRRRRVEALADENAGTLLRDRGRLAEAEARYRAALTSYDALARGAPADEELALARSRTRCWLGEALRGQGRVAAARAEFERALGDARQVYQARQARRAEAARLRAATLAVARAQSALGLALLDQAEPVAALSLFDELLQLVEPLHREGGWDVLLAMHDGLDGKASAFELLGRKEDALLLYAKAAPIARQLDRAGARAAEAQLRGAIVMIRILTRLPASDDQEYRRFRIEGWRKVTAVLDELARADPENASREADAIVARRLREDQRLASLRPGEERRPAVIRRATRKLLAARTRMEELTRRDPGNALWRGELAGIRQSYGRALSMAGDEVGARVEFLAAAALREELARTDPTDASARFLVGDAQVPLCDGAADAAARPAECGKARAVFAELLGAHPAAASYAEAVRSAAEREVRALAEAGAPEKAAEARREADAALRAFREAGGQATLVAALDELARAEQLQADPAAAARAYDLAVTALRSVAATHPPDPWVYSRLSRALRARAAISDATPAGLGQARAACAEAAEAAAQAVALAPASADERMVLAAAHQCRAELATDGAVARAARDEAILAASEACDREPGDDGPWRALLGYRRASAAALEAAADPAAALAEYRLLVADATRAVGAAPEELERWRQLYEAQLSVAESTTAARDAGAARQALDAALAAAHEAEALEGLTYEVRSQVRGDVARIERRIQELDSSAM